MKKSRLIYVNLVWIPFLFVFVVFGYLYFAGLGNRAGLTGMAFCIGTVFSLAFSGDKYQQKFAISSRSELRAFKTGLQKDYPGKIIVLKLFREVTVHYL